MIRRALLSALAGLAIVACDNPLDAYPGQVSTSFDGGKRLILVASYSQSAMATGILAWADVPGGTAGTIDMTGPLHMRCAGTFQPVPPEFNDPGNRPALDVGDGHNGANFHSPSGSYTVTVAIPSKKASIKKSLTAGYSSLGIDGVWDLPSGCVPVADTRQQLQDLTASNLHALAYWIGRLDDGSPLKSELVPLVATAGRAVLAGDTAGALDALERIRASVSATSRTTYEVRTYCESNIAIALLTQLVPAN